MNSLCKGLNLSKCILLCGLALDLPVHVAYGDNFSGTDLLGMCREPSSEEDMDEEDMVGLSYCAGLVTGIIALNDTYRQYALKKDVPLFCAPKDGVPIEEGARVIVKYLQDHPEQLHFTDATLAILAFKSAFPCRR
jgi:hypothetical protein